MEESTTCCGFGGTFAIKQTDISTAMVAKKVEHALATGAESQTEGGVTEPNPTRDN